MLLWNVDDEEYTTETVAKGREIFKRDVAVGTLKCVKTVVDYEAQRKKWVSDRWQSREKTFFDCNYGTDESARSHQALFNPFGEDDVARNLRVKSVPFKNEDYDKFYNSHTTSEKEYVYMKLVWNEERK